MKDLKVLQGRLVHVVGVLRRTIYRHREPLITISKLVAVFGVPLVVVVSLYPISSKIIFNGIIYQQSDFVIENIFHDEPSWKNQLADVLDFPLFLNWYRVSIVNNAFFEIPACAEDRTPAIIYFHFHKGDPRTYDSDIQETTRESGGYIGGNLGHPSYFLRGGETAYFVAPSNEMYSINGGLMFSEDCERNNDTISQTERMHSVFAYTISVRPHLPAWFTRLVLIFALWLAVLSSWISIWNWLKGNRNRTTVS